MKTLITTLGVGLAMFALSDSASAHGGQYRGPGDVVPPNPGGGGPRTPGASGPSSPGPSGPSSPGPAGPSSPGAGGPATGGAPGAPPPGGGGPTTRGGIQIEDDLTSWQFWWEFNNDPYINLREAIHSTKVVTESDEFFVGSGKTSEAKNTLAPSEATIKSKIVPALVAMLDATDDRDIKSACLVALAKIGIEPEGQTLNQLFKKFLPENDQEIQETAALSMGIAQDESSVADLVALIKNEADGKKLVDGDVNNRTRTFAAYGLGLVAWATTDSDVKQTVYDALVPVLEDKKEADRNIRVAAIQGLSLLRPNVEDQKGMKLFKDTVNALRGYYEQPLGKGDQLMQSHVPTSVAKLFIDVDYKDNDELRTLHTEMRKLFLNDLRGRSKTRDQNDIFRSAAMSLGMMSNPVDDPKKIDKDDEVAMLDVEVQRELYKHAIDGRDQAAKHFSYMAMGQQGGLLNREQLLSRIRKISSVVEKPWPAVALGVMSFEYDQDEEYTGEDINPNYIGERLQAELATKSPEVISGIAIALGLSKYEAAGDQLLEILEDRKSDDRLAGLICIGLALMNDSNAIQPIQKLVRESVRRDERLRQAAIALGKLGDKEAGSILIEMMTADENPGVQKMAAISTALSFIGDRESVDPLIKMLNNENATPLARAFAAVALGGLADKEPLPWNSKIGVDMNYLASVETLTNGSAGVLDIL